MLIHYLRIGLRNIARNRLYSAINIFGLTFGLTCCILIGLYIDRELSYDRFNEKADRIYRIHSEEAGFGLSTNSAPALYERLNHYPEADASVRVFRHWFQPLISRNKEKGFIEEQFFYADSSLFDVFTMSMLRGEGKRALSVPFNVLITETMAHKYFGDENPVGQILKYNAEKDFKVAGVIRDFPSNAHFNPDFIASITTCNQLFWPTFLSSWGSLLKTYVVLKPGTDIPAFAEKLTGIYRERFGSQNKVAIQLMPLTDIHLRSTVAQDFGKNNDIRYVRLLGILGIIILTISMVNYMNLTAARGMTRAKEVGIRQVMGVQRKNLIMQFLAESTLFALLAVVAAVIAVEVSLPAVNTAIQSHLFFEDFSIPLVLFGLLSAAVLIGILGGLYPAFVLSRFRAIQVLKGKIDGVRSGWIRKFLVVSQFAAGVVLFIATLVIVNQMNFIRASRTGFTQDEIAVVPLKDPNVALNLPALKEEWRRVPGVAAVGLANAMPGKAHAGDYLVLNGKTEDVAVSVNWSDEGFVPVMEIGLAAGRNIAPERPSDSEGSILINEEAAKQLGFAQPNDALGKQVKLRGSDGGRSREIVGVVKDFNYETLHYKIEPLVIVPQFDRCAYLMIRMKAADLHETLAKMRRAWSGLAAEQPFTYFFMDENFQRLYLEDERWTWVIGAGAGAAITIACLGLFGLAIFTTQRRTKEIGIRKILGASEEQIIRVLIKEYIFLILAANLIAWPIVYLWMNDWLSQFAYRTTISWSVFPLALGATVGIAVLTIGFQALRAAAANPVDALKYE